MLYITHGTDRAKQKVYIDSLKQSFKSSDSVRYLVVERGDFKIEDFPAPLAVF